MKNILLLIILFAALRVSSAPAPNFTITTSDNQALQLYQNFINQGKVVVLEAFFTTCPPCGTHAPHFQNLYTQMLAAYPGKVEFIMLSTLTSDTNVKVAQYKTSKSLTMPAAGFDGGSTTALQPYTSGTFGPFLGTPTFIVIAPNTGEVHFDIRGNSASQTMALLSQKIAELLPPPPPPLVYCDVKNFFDTNLSAVEMRVDASPFDTTFMFDGSYTLSNIPVLQNKTYSLNPEKNDNPLNGITTYDLVLISKHILGIQALECDWQLLAADVNCSGSITTLDIVTARKLILGIDQDLQCGSWRFVPDSAVASNGDCMEFLGVKIGDVTAGPCAQFAPSADDRSPLEINMMDRMLRPGETAIVAVHTSEKLQLNGLQAAFLADQSQLNITQISSQVISDFDNEAYALDHRTEGAVPVSWFNPNAQTVNIGDALLLLQVHSVQGGRLSDLLGIDSGARLMPEAYGAGGGIRPLSLRWHDGGNSVVSDTKVVIRPNPSHGQFNIAVALDHPESCMIEVTDIQGRKVFQKAFDGTTGVNTWPLELNNSAPGLFCLRVNGRSAGKIVIE